MGQRGGYILHLDGTCEGDSPHLISGLDGISEIVLDNIKLPSENGKQLTPFLENIKRGFGKPLAIVRDMGKGISNAIESVFGEKVLDFICHFHFLRDIGKDLLAEQYDIIRKRLRKHKISSQLRYRAKQLKRRIDQDLGMIDVLKASIENQPLPASSFQRLPVLNGYSLILWALEGRTEGDGYGFPFDRPYVTFVQRLRSLYVHLEELRNIRLRGEWRDNTPFFKVYCHLKEVFSDKLLRKAMTEIESKIEVFDKLRDAMRITVDEEHQGLNDDGEEVDIKTIEEGVEDFREWLLQDDRYSKNKDYQKMIEQIDKYWQKLFADSITVETPQGKVTFQPQRTNNLLERFFRDIEFPFTFLSESQYTIPNPKCNLAQTFRIKPQMTTLKG